MEPDSFLTISKENTFYTKEKGSKFIGRVFPANSRDRAEDIIALINKQFYDATHNCFAYRIGFGGNEQTRFSDDGEPLGTAGKPLLQSIVGENLTNVCLVVTRYFGGTKLGTGGLMRAYSKAATEVIKKCSIEKVYLKTRVTLRFQYDLTSSVFRMVEKFDGEIQSQQFKEFVELVIFVRLSQLDQFVNQLIENTAGKIEINQQSG